MITQDVRDCAEKIELKWHVLKDEKGRVRSEWIAKLIQELIEKREKESAAEVKTELHRYSDEIYRSIVPPHCVKIINVGRHMAGLQAVAEKAVKPWMENAEIYQKQIAKERETSRKLYDALKRVQDLQKACYGSGIKTHLELASLMPIVEEALAEFEKGEK